MRRIRLILTLALCTTLSISAACSGATDNNETNNTTSSANNTTSGANNTTAGTNNTTSGTNNTTAGTNNASTGGTNNLTGDGAAAYTGLVINEVAASGVPTDWVELYNGSDKTLSLVGLGLTDTLDEPKKAILGELSIVPGAFLVIDVDDSEAAPFKLGSDEEVHLIAPNGEVIDSADWDEGGSPAGGSFARKIDGTGDFETTAEATRGATNAITPSLGAIVRINEVTSSGDDLIELVNIGDEAADLSGWYVTDDSYDPQVPEEKRYSFAPGTTLAPGAFMVLTKGQEHTFGLGSDDAVVLHDADDVVVDQADWAADEAVTSYCRATDGEGAFAPCDPATFGVSNGGE